MNNPETKLPLIERARQLSLEIRLDTIAYRIKELQGGVPDGSKALKEILKGYAKLGIIYANLPFPNYYDATLCTESEQDVLNQSEPFQEFLQACVEDGILIEMHTRPSFSSADEPKAYLRAQLTDAGPFGREMLEVAKQARDTAIRTRLDQIREEVEGAIMNAIKRNKGAMPDSVSFTFPNLLHSFTLSDALHTFGHGNLIAPDPIALTSENVKTESAAMMAFCKDMRNEGLTVSVMGFNDDRNANEWTLFLKLTG